ncbi:MAG: archaemetzincin family Zn-dependent metalloprotease [Promethearchaeota archaeon]
MVKIGKVKHSILANLSNKLKSSFSIFNISINPVMNFIPLVDSEYNLIRRQYYASKILNRILNYGQQEGFFRTLGIIDKDIFTSSLNFVFGLAISPKNRITDGSVAALISITRLREGFYRRADNNDIFELRIQKEAIHELGHTFNLGHCDKFCIMRFSNSLADTDEKPVKFCNICMNKLNNFFNT